MLSLTSPVVPGPSLAAAGFWYRYMVEKTSASARPLVYAHLRDLHIILAVCGPGMGGPDFRFGAAQLAWLREQLSHVPTGTEIALFMHTYPAASRWAPGKKMASWVCSLGPIKMPGRSTPVGKVSRP
jgi:hypothetical protein